MPATAPAIENLTLSITQEIHVRSSMTATFAALLEEMGPANVTPDGNPLPMRIEPWPGGRWFRDLGDQNGHFWGLVQAIKRPTLLELTGPLFMSAPVVSNLQYRLTQVDRRNAHHLPAHRVRAHSGRSSRGSVRRVDAPSRGSQETRRSVVRTRSNASPCARRSRLAVFRRVRRPGPRRNESSPGRAAS